jgi:cytochrome b involved in lipid metabolism
MWFTTIGFATRAATADAVSTLYTTCPGAFSFPGHSTTYPTVRLLRVLYFASEREHGQGVRDKMAHALGNLAANTMDDCWVVFHAEVYDMTRFANEHPGGSFRWD